MLLKRVRRHRFFSLVKLATRNSYPEYEISNRNFLSSDIEDDRDSDGRRNTSRWLFLARETSTTGKEITFHQATYPAPGVYGLGAANDIRGGWRKEDFDDSAHFRSFVFRWGARVITVLSNGTENVGWSARRLRETKLLFTDFHGLLENLLEVRTLSSNNCKLFFNTNNL